MSSAAELAQAVADPSVASIVLRAHVALAGLALVVSGRSLSVSGDAASCGPAPAPLGLPASPAACAIDARGLSRHFTVLAGAHLSLAGVALVNGAAPQGGSLLAVGAAVSASRSLFAHSRALGDGGAALGLAGSSLSFQSCASTIQRFRAAPALPPLSPHGPPRPPR